MGSLRRARRHAWGVTLALLTAACGSSSVPGAIDGGAGGGADNNFYDPAPLAPPATCPTLTDATRFANADRLYALDLALAGFGDRPTGGAHHQAYYSWLKARVSAIAGAQISELPYQINLWTPGAISLAAGANAGALAELSVAGPVPYALHTPAGGITAPLAYVPVGTAIGATESGKIVLREMETGSVPNAALAALQWFTFDPGLTLTLNVAGNYERDYLAYDKRITDLNNAAAVGAAGLIFMHGFPEDRIRGHYEPYEGEHWQVPALYVGADQGARLKELASAGGVARMNLESSDAPTQTRTLVATIPGQSAERIVIESHTDGMNALWDNGPLVMLEMARYFADLGLDCRPKTLQFVFTTAHIYQKLFPPKRHGGAGQVARQLNQDYNAGTVAYVLALEHFGGIELGAVARTDGGPGRDLVPTGKNEPTSVFISDSPSLVALTAAAIAGRGLDRSIALHGAALPGPTIPEFTNFGGEGTPYQEYALPTVAFIVASWALYNPNFRIEEVIDPALMYQQSLTFTDLVHLTSRVPRQVLAGGMLAERAARDAACAAGQTTVAVCD